MSKNLPARQEPGAMVRASKIETVSVDDKGGPSRPIPPQLKGRVMKEAPGLAPTVDWQPIKELPDQWVLGHYLGSKELKLFDRLSILYQLADAQSGEVIGVWGGTVLDTKMNQLAPTKGALLLIQYLGDLPQKPGQSAARDFRVALVAAPEA